MPPPKLPPGAKLVPDDVKLPQGATVIQPDTAKEPTAQPTGTRGGGNPRGTSPELAAKRKAAITGIINEYPGYVQMGEGSRQIMTPGMRKEGLHNLVTGVGKFAAVPLLPIAAVSNPIATIGGIVGGGLGSSAGEYVSKKMGAEDDTAALVGDASGIAGGTLGQMGANALGRKYLGPLGEMWSKYWMRKSLNPNQRDAPSIENVDAQVNMALKDAVPMTKRGAARATSLAGESGKKVGDVITDLDNRGRSIRPEDVARRVDDINTAQVSPEADIADIQAVKEGFLQRNGVRPGTPATQPTPIVANGKPLLDAQGNPAIRPGSPAKPSTPGTPIRPSTAQAEKTGTHQKVNYGKESPAAIEAEKALARGYREELESLAPELRGLNEEWGTRLQLEKTIRDGLRRNYTKPTVSLTDEAAVAGGAMVGGTPAAIATGVSRFALRPGFRSKLAIGIYQGAKGIGKPISWPDAIAKATAVTAAMQGDQENQQ